MFTEVSFVSIYIDHDFLIIEIENIYHIYIKE